MHAAVLPRPIDRGVQWARTGRYPGSRTFRLGTAFPGLPEWPGRSVMLRPTASSWSDHSGGTAPDFHRLPCLRPTIRKLSRPTYTPHGRGVKPRPATMGCAGSTPVRRQQQAPPRSTPKVNREIACVDAGDRQARLLVAQRDEACICEVHPTRLVTENLRSHGRELLGQKMSTEKETVGQPAEEAVDRRFACLLEQKHGLRNASFCREPRPAQRRQKVPCPSVMCVRCVQQGDQVTGINDGATDHIRPCGDD